VKAQINEAMQQIQQQSCIRFVEMAKNEDNNDGDDAEDKDNKDAVQFFMGKKFVLSELSIRNHFGFKFGEILAITEKNRFDME
jgi:hypothetical protein